MKAVLVGTDLMYRKDGSLAPIEINTNVGWDNANRVESESKVFDATELAEYLKAHNIKKVVLEGVALRIKKALQELLEGVEISTVRADKVLALEDADDIFILRSTYSDEALVDSFCRDKIAFLKSIVDTDFGCEYLLKTADGFEGNITELEEYGEGVPNFILKYRYPNYSKKEYPKLLRFESIADLMDFAESEEMPEDFFLMPFYYCESELYSGNRIKLIRNFSVFTANEEGNLDSIEVGKYTKLCDKLDLENVKYLENGELDPEYREMFLSANWFERAIKEEAALLDKGDLVWMADGSWKKIEDLKVGEFVKSLEVPAKKGYNTEKHTGNYGVTVEELETETHFIENEVKVIKKLNRVDSIINFKFTDGTDWYDTVKSSYPTVNAKGLVEFKTLNSIEEGDTVILVSLEDTENPKFITKVVEEVKEERKLLENGYTLELDGSHLFISRTQEDKQAYASIEHNANPITCHTVLIWENVVLEGYSEIMGFRFTGPFDAPTPLAMREDDGAIVEVPDALTYNVTTDQPGHNISDDESAFIGIYQNGNELYSTELTTPCFTQQIQTLNKNDYMYVFGSPISFNGSSISVYGVGEGGDLDPSESDQLMQTLDIYSWELDHKIADISLDLYVKS